MLYMTKYQHGIRNIDVTYAPVKPLGVVSSSDFISAIHPGQTFLVTLMLTNNKLGEFQPLANVAAFCREFQMLLHTNVAHVVREVPMDLIGALGETDIVTLVGHKFGPPKSSCSVYSTRVTA